MFQQQQNEAAQENTVQFISEKLQWGQKRNMREIIKYQKGNPKQYHFYKIYL